MKIAIVGSRSITDYKAVELALAESPWYRPSPFAHNSYTFVSGGADGVDSIAEEIAERHSEGTSTDIEMEVYEPDYSDWWSGDEHPARRRNTKIVEQSDVVVAIWDGNSNGTRDTIDKALDRGKSLYVKVVDDG